MPRLKDRRHDASRREILDATRAVLDRSGVPGLTLEAVARRLGVTKQALYYYFASKEALLFEVVMFESTAVADQMHAATTAAPDGAAALEAIIRSYVAYFAPRLDSYRLIAQHVQLVSQRRITAEQIARIRPLNDRMYGVAEQKLAADQARGAVHPSVHPRRLAFAAHVAATGLIATKALVERFEDPLRHSDDALIAELCRAFRAAARHGGTA